MRHQEDRELMVAFLRCGEGIAAKLDSYQDRTDFEDITDSGDSGANWVIHWDGLSLCGHQEIRPSPEYLAYLFLEVEMPWKCDDVLAKIADAVVSEVLERIPSISFYTASQRYMCHPVESRRRDRKPYNFGFEFWIAEKVRRVIGPKGEIELVKVFDWPLQTEADGSRDTLEPDKS